MRRFGSLLLLKLTPRSLPSTGRTTALFASFTFELEPSREEARDVRHHPLPRRWLTDVDRDSATRKNCALRVDCISTSVANGRAAVMRTSRASSRGGSSQKERGEECRGSTRRAEVLGFSFSNNKEPKRRFAPKAWSRCRQKSGN